MVESITELYASVLATTEPSLAAIASARQTTIAFLSAYGESLSCVWDRLSILVPIANLFEFLSSDSPIKACKMNLDF